MKKANSILLALSLVINTVHAESPTEYWSMTTNLLTTQTLVNIKAVENPREFCEKESFRVGNRGFLGVPIVSCAFWTKDKCTIIAGLVTNNDILGHELRHCLQGNFH